MSTKRTCCLCQVVHTDDDAFEFICRCPANQGVCGACLSQHLTARDRLLAAWKALGREHAIRWRVKDTRWPAEFASVMILMMVANGEREPPGTTSRNTRRVTAENWYDGLAEGKLHAPEQPTRPPSMWVYPLIGLFLFCLWVVLFY